MAVAGSLFGLDLTLSTKRLRRIALDGLPHPPRLSSNDSSAFVDILALITPRSLTSDDLSSIERAITSGREQVQAATDAASLDRAGGARVDEREPSPTCCLDAATGARARANDLLDGRDVLARHQ